jgi:hypothetical protein
MPDIREFIRLATANLDVGQFVASGSAGMPLPAGRGKRTFAGRP